MQYQFEINYKMPSLNEVINISRQNRYAGNKLKQDIERVLKSQLYRQKLEDGIENYPIKNIVDVEITYIEKNKKRDKDNIASSKKFIFDSLVRIGILQNDNWHYIGDFRETFEIGNDYRVVIRLNERG